MADLQINGLPANAGLVGTEEVAVQLTGGGANQKTTAQDIADLGGGGGGSSGYAVGPGLTVEPVAAGTDSLAMGDAAVATDEDNIAIGRDSATSGVYAIAIGGQATAGITGTALGRLAVATTTLGVSVGYISSALTAGAVALGGQTDAITGTYPTAVGSYALASGANSIAIGSASTRANSAQATGSGAVALGNGTSSTSASSVAIGTDSQAEGSRAIAIGSGFNPFVGTPTRANGLESIAIGFGAKAIASGQITLGSSAGGGNTGCTDTIAIGNRANATNSNVTQAIAIGAYAAVSIASAAVIGSGAAANQGPRADRTNEMNISMGLDGDVSRAGHFTAVIVTTTATPGLFDISIPSSTTLVADAMIVARRTDADDENAAWLLRACIKRGILPATVSLVAAETKELIAEDAAAAAWDVAFIAETGGNSLRLQVTGEGAKTIQWTAKINYAETRG